jgi:oligopeptidase B
MQPPVAKRIPHPHTLHGDVRPDDYYWLRERENPEVIRYLEAENAYTEATLEPLKPLADRLYQDMVRHVAETDVGVPVQHGPYFYYHRFEAGRQYPVFCRKRAATRDELDAAPEEVVLDQNQRAEGHAFCSITWLRPSPDHRRLAFLENTDGSDRYTLYVRDLETGEELPDVVPNVYLHASVAWDASGHYLFYVTVDEAQRPCRLWRHHLGAPSEKDALLYEERDTTFTLVVHPSLSGRFLFARSTSTTTDEVRFLPADRPTDSWQVFLPRRRGVEYSVEHWGDRFVVLTNEDAENFSVWSCPLDDTRREAWTPVVEGSAARYLEGLLPCRNLLLIEGREEGLTQLWVYADGRLDRLAWEEPLYTVGFGDNRDGSAPELLITYESLVTPPSVYSFNVASHALTLLKRQPVPEYDPEQYVQERVWATASDGVRIPVSLVYRRGARDGGPAPLWLYGYGSYGASMDPAFQATRLPLLDRGVLYAIAHIRGGSEMGRRWYLDGKLLHKRNTFTDFIAAAEALIAQGYTTPERMAAEGRSAGGLLMGAVLNMRPDLFRVAIAGVPFVDVLTTMLDPSIPLTSLEWDEWGNPADPAFYAYMRTYSPYDNVTAQAYPHLFVEAGLNDPRVGYFEPAKWVARLRATKTDDHTLLFWTHLGAGHSGSSGRYDRLRERARQFAFALDKLGINA